MSDEREMQVGYSNPASLGIPGLVTSVFAGKSDEDSIEPMIFIQIQTMSGTPVLVAVAVPAEEFDNFIAQVVEMAKDALSALENPQPIIDRELNKLLDPGSPL